MSPAHNKSQSKIGDATNKEEEGEVVYETAQGETAETAQETRHMASLESREARRKKKPRKQGSRKELRGAGETLSALS